MARFTLKHQSGFHFEGQDEHGNVIQMDGNQKNGPSPMESLLAAAGACSGIDVVSILEKMREPLESLEVIVDGDKEKVGEHKEWRNIVMRFVVKGDVNEEKLKKAIELSVQKYCSVSMSLRPQAKIVTEYEIL